MQSTQELKCSECQTEYKSAYLLLCHFAEHAAKALPQATSKKAKRSIPKLYPIKSNRVNTEGGDVGSDSGIEDVNPMKFCVVTMKEEGGGKPHNVKKYQCSYCNKKFGWTTDLKRHIMTHTGERPFKCRLCDSSFTRNFLLLKHNKKCHDKTELNLKIPELKPIKSRKQAKSEIKRVKPGCDEGLTCST